VGLRDLVSLVWSNLRRMRGRVMMTASGVAIGTAAVVVLVSLGAGLQQQARKSLMSGSGMTQLRVNAPINYMTDLNDPTMPRGRDQDTPERQVIDERALAKLRELPNVEAIVSLEPLMAQHKVEYGRLEGYATVFGIKTGDLQVLDVSVASGTLATGRGQAVLGAQVAELLHDPAQRANRTREQELTLTQQEGIVPLQGATLRLHIKRFTEDGTVVEKTVRLQVVGVLEASGWRYDHNIYVPMRDVIDYATWAQGRRREPGRQGYAEIVLKTSDAKSLLALEEQVTGMGFSVWSDRQQVEEANAYFAKLQAILGAIGAVALLVAAFGIANTMLMAIYERTGEIGLMKAIGASNKTVMRVFLAESAGIGLIGGASGIVLAVLVNGAINLIAKSVSAEQLALVGPTVEATGHVTYTPLWLPLFAVAFATLVGIASGAYPASRAAALSPIRALKYE
jgi:putative ABC transport system permease protein